MKRHLFFLIAAVITLWTEEANTALRRLAPPAAKLLGLSTARKYSIVDVARTFPSNPSKAPSTTNRHPLSTAATLSTEKGDQTQSPLFKAILNNDATAVTDLLARGTSIYPVHLDVAVEKNNPAIIALLRRRLLEQQHAEELRLGC